MSLFKWPFFRALDLAVEPGDVTGNTSEHDDPFVRFYALEPILPSRGGLARVFRRE